MSCKCGSNRVMSLSMKHNDLTSLSIPHLNIERDSDYFPYMGFLGGDDTQFSVCLDCGTIQHWEPISDGEIMTAMDIEEDEVQEEQEFADVYTLDDYMSGKDNTYPSEVQYTHNGKDYELELTKIIQLRNQHAQLLEGFYNVGWRGSAEVRQILKNSIESPPSIYDGAAAYMLLKEIE